jgi:predicted metallopeptidase
MEDIVKLLMKRDRISRQEAQDLVDETIELLLVADIWESDEIVAGQLGLEPDYIMDLLGLN